MVEVKCVYTGRQLNYLLNTNLFDEDKTYFVKDLKKLANTLPREGSDA